MDGLKEPQGESNFEHLDGDSWRSIKVALNITGTRLEFFIFFSALLLGRFLILGEEGKRSYPGLGQASLVNIASLEAVLDESILGVTMA